MEITRDRELNPEVDLEVDVNDLDAELRSYSLVLNRYYTYEARLCSIRDIAEAKLEELEASTYKSIKSDISVKHTEKSIDAEINTNPTIIEAKMKLIRTQHDVATWHGSVVSMLAKKDMLIQLSANSRKEK